MSKKLTESRAERFLQGFSAMVEDYLAQKEANKAVSATYTQYGHGPGGLFSTPMEPDIMTAMQLPLKGLLADLPEIPTNKELPLFAIVTGQTAGTDTTPVTSSCDAWGAAGLTKLCRQYAVLGTEGISSQPIDLNELGRLTDRADFLDYRLIGDPFSMSYGGNIPEPLPGRGGPNDFLNDSLAKIMREMEVESERRFAPDVYTANPSTAADAYHSEWYRGLDLQVNTGYQDAVANVNGGGGGAVRCEKADSTIIPFATVSVTGNNISTDATAASLIVELIADLVYMFDRMQNEMGIFPVTWKFVGTPGLFRELTAVWPCSYLTNRCLTASAANPQVVEATEQVRMREEMRAGSFLWVDAVKIPFIQDSTITETQGAGAAGAGTFTSDLYYLPYIIRGNFPVLFRTYFSYNSPYAAADAIQKLGPMMYGSSVSPNGKYLFSMDKTYDCVKIKATRRPGLVLRTPYIAARITNIAYRTRLVVPSWNPNAPSNYLNGGVTVGTPPSYWKPTTNG